MNIVRMLIYVIWWLPMSIFKKYDWKRDYFPLIGLMLPLILAGMVGGLNYFFITVFLARLGPKALAAGAMVGWLYAVFYIVVFGILGSINILIANFYGQQKTSDIIAVVRDGLLLALILFVPSFLLFLNMEPIFLFLGQKAPLVKLAKPYLFALACGLLPNFLLQAFYEPLVGMGKMRPVVIFTILNVLLTIFFSYAFIFGLNPFPNFGIAGAGWGITVASFITLASMFTYFIFYSPYKIYIKQILHFEKPQFLIELLVIGFPVGLMYSLEVGFFFAMTLVIGTYGHDLLAANQVALQYLGLLIGSIFSIAQAITVRMGHLLGASSHRQAKDSLYVGIQIAFIFVLFFSLVDWVFPNLLIRLDFNKNPEELPKVYHHAKYFLWMVGAFQLFEAIRICIFGALRALKDTKFTMVSSLVIFWIIAFPIGWLLEIKFDFQGLGIWGSLNISIILGIVWLKKRLGHSFLNYLH